LTFLLAISVRKETSPMSKAISSERAASHLLRLSAPGAFVISLVTLGVLLANLASAGSPTIESGGPYVPQCDPNWQVVSSPNVGTSANNLWGVDAAIIGGDVWAVGDYYDTSAVRYQTLIERGSGGQWNVASSPNQGTSDNHLSGVADVFANDAWAVGDYFNPSEERTLIEHWNGTQWSIVSSPNQGTGSNVLNAVSINAPNDVWAVGYYVSNNTWHTLIERWNGTHWSIVASPDGGTMGNQLNSVAVVSANNVWAVGTYGASNNTSRTLALHWNGSTWSTVTTPNAGGSLSNNYLDGMTVVSAADIWAVGNYYNTVLGKRQTLILHWNGTAWSIVASPNGSPSDNYLNAVEKVSASSIWAVGYYFDLNASQRHTLVEHWNGSGWSVIPSPNVGTGQNILNGVAVVSGSDVWAAGYYQGSNYRTLIERYNPCTGTATPTNGPRQTDTPSPSPTSTRTSLPTQTPGGPTATPIPTNTPTATPTNTPPNTATGTPSATPTHCAIQFADVPPGSTFYDYIMCLACRGLISGYACGGTGEPCNPAHDPYFRPNANVTRGQIAKFISNAAGYNDSIPVSRQTFTDVPYHSTYWLFVERVYLHGIISGYTDPLQCLRVGVPCFHPESNVKRGQAAKFVSNAAGYNDNIPPNQQTFDDVPYSHPFWLYIERVYLHGIIFGYPPCEQDGIPCFKPDNHVTRGQTAKIVSRAFFPTCSTPSGKENDPTLQR